MQVKGVIEEENNLFVLLHDNEVWVKATAGNVVKDLFAKGACEFGDIVNVIWSSSWCISFKFWFVFVSIMFEYHQIMMTRRDSLRHLATSPPPGLMPLVPCNITEGFSHSSQPFVQFMFFFMYFSKLSFLYFIFCIGHNLIHFRKGCVRTKKIVRVVKIFQLFT